MATRRHVLGGLAAGALSQLLPAGLLAASRRSAATGNLGAIRAVTFTAADLAVAQSAWTTFMGYRLISRGRIPASTARSWGIPNLTGRPYLIVGPASGEPTYVRFVEQPSADPSSFSRKVGWTAAEFTVQNTDALYARLKDSPFRVMRPPRPIPTYSYLRAMHAVGPSGEQLNLTWITQRRPDLAVAESFVGRCFIAVLGAPDFSAALAYYHDTFGNTPSAPRNLPMLELAVLPLSDGTKIEVDNAAASSGTRNSGRGDLPPGLAMVTFEHHDIGAISDQFISPPAANSLEPFPGRHSGVIRGPAGELIEIVET